MKTSLKGKMASIVLAVTVVGAMAGATAAMADNDYRGYHDWDHHNGWHRHSDERVYYTGPTGYYEPGVTYGGSYPQAVPNGAYYSPYEPGFSVNIR
jgi:hypothetical protein